MRSTVQERLKAIKKQYGSKELGKVTVDMTIGGMRGITVTTAQCIESWQNLYCHTFGKMYSYDG